MSTATQWLSVKEAAVYLGVQESTLYAWINKRRIPFHKIPGSHLVRFKVTDLDKWVESGRVETLGEYLQQKE